MNMRIRLELIKAKYRLSSQANVVVLSGILQTLQSRMMNKLLKYVFKSNRQRTGPCGAHSIKSSKNEMIYLLQVFANNLINSLTITLTTLYQTHPNFHGQKFMLKSAKCLRQIYHHSPVKPLLSMVSSLFLKPFL